MNLLPEGETQRTRCASRRGTPPCTPALFEGTPLEQPRCALSSSLILGQLFTDLALESSGRGKTPREMPKTYTHTHCLLLFFPLPFPTPLAGGDQPGFCGHSMALCGPRQNSHTCARSTTIREPVAVVLYRPSALRCGWTAPERPRSCFASPRQRDLDLSLPPNLLTIWRTLRKSATLSSNSSFQKSRSFDVALMTLFHGRLGTNAEISGLESWNCA